MSSNNGGNLSFRTDFSELFSPVRSEPETNVLLQEQRSVLVDCSGSTHNLYVKTEQGLLSVFDLFGSLATALAQDIREEGKGIDLVPFASKYEVYPKQQSEMVQTVYSLAEEQGLFNQLGEGTDLYDPLEKTLNDLVEHAGQVKAAGEPKIRSTIIVLTDGMPTGGLQGLDSLRDLCVRKFQQLQELGYTDKDLSLCFVTVHPDALSEQWENSENQSLEKWRDATEAAEAFYAKLDQELEKDEQIHFDFVSHLRLCEVAKMGVRSFLESLQKSLVVDES